MTKDQWVWMPHPGHFIASNSCQFRLNTCVGKYIVSTVGEYEAPLIPSLRINNKGWMELGVDRLYETMVFRAEESSNPCCPFSAIVQGGELDMQGYNDALSARIGHMEMCEKWSNHD